MEVKARSVSPLNSLITGSTFDEATFVS